MFSLRQISNPLPFWIAVSALFVVASSSTSVLGQSLATTKGVRTVGLTGSFPGIWQPNINDAGQVAFGSVFIGPIYSETGNAGLRTVLNTGDPAPGLAGSTISQFDGLTPRIGNQDIVAFSGRASDGTTTRSAIWTQQGTAPIQLLAAQGMAAPGLPGMTFRGFGSPFVMGDDGQIAIQGNFTGPGVTQGVNDQGVWAQKTVGGPLELVAASGQITPGLPDNTFKSFAFPTVNNSGGIAFQTTITSSSGDRGAIWTDDATSGLVLKATTQAAVPGLSPSIHLIAFGGNEVSLNDSGDIGFYGRLSGPGISSSNEAVFLAETNSGFRIALQQGQTVAGLPTGQVISSDFANTVINSVGEITSLAFLTGTGIDSTNSRVLITEDGGTPLRIVARDGDQVPDLPTGIYYSTITANYGFEVNSHNVLVFSANLTGPGTSSGMKDSGYFAEIAPGIVKSLVLNGDTIEVAPSVFKTISGLQTSRGFERYLNDNNQFTFEANFTDGTKGIFVVTIPEAGTTTLLSIAALAFVACGIAKRAKRHVA